jgi:hypothetical protein
MKKFVLLLAFILALSGIDKVFAQQVYVGIGAGMCKSGMSGLKTINQNVMSSLPFGAKQIENFPAAMEYNLELVVSLVNRYSAGFYYNFYSTGSRISLKDYSGEFRFDNISSNHSFGLINKYSVYQAKAFQVQFTLALGYYNSTFKLAEELKVYDTDIVSEDYKFKSKGIFIRPGVTALYSFKIINIGLYGSYYINTHNDIYLDENSDLKLTDETSGDNIKTDWGGFQFGVITSICIINFKQNK